MMPTQIIRFLFERGEFTSASTEAVGKALFYYSLGILPSGLWASILSIYYAKKKMWKQLILYVLFFLLSVAFTALFINTLSYNAIPLAWSISYWLVVISGGVYVLKKVGIDIIKLKKTVFTGIIAASGMALFIFTYLLCATKIPSLQKDVVMVGCIFLSLGIYVGILRLINAEELDFILNVLRMS
jgi:putative peptidoglycan lipid II flippase